MKNQARFLSTLLFIASFLISPQAVWSARFVDLDKNWAEKPVNHLSDKGVIPAADNGKFEPNTPILRSDMAVWLAKVLELGSQDPPADVSFDDVKDDDKNAKSIKLTAKYFETEGKSFHPEKSLSRAELFCVLARALDQPEPDEKTINLTVENFPDGPKIPDWAKSGFTALYNAGVFVAPPESDGRVNGSDTATRADCASLLDRLDQFRTDAAVAKAIADGEKKPVTTVTIDPSKVIAEVSDDPEVVEQSPSVPVDIIPRGTAFELRLESGLDSSKNKRGEKVKAASNKIVTTSEGRSIDADTDFKGELTNVISAKRFFGAPGRITMRFYELELADGQRCAISARVDSSKTRLTGGEPGERGKKLAKNAAKGAGTGFLIGSILAPAVMAAVSAAGPYGSLAGVGTQMAGAATGAVIGAGMTKGEELRWDKARPVEIVLDRPLRLPTHNPKPIEQPVFEE